MFESLNFLVSKLGRSVIFALVACGLLAITFHATRQVVDRINGWAKAMAARDFDEHLYWCEPKGQADPKIHVPATDHTLEIDPKDNRRSINPVEIGAKHDRSDIPEALGDVERWFRALPDHDPANVSTNDYRSASKWNGEARTFLLDNVKIEDPFDLIYKERLGINLNPIRREKDFRKLLNYPDLYNRETSTGGREKMLRHFSNVYGDMMKFNGCRVIRWINGWVQVTAIGAFVLTAIVVSIQFAQGVVLEYILASRFFPFRRPSWDRTVRWTDPPDNGSLLTPDRVDQELKALHGVRIRGAAALMLIEAYEAYQRGELNAQNYRDTPGAAEALDRAADREHHKVESRMAALVYLGWSLPSLGFIGTVLGLGSALLTAGDMVTPNSELQRDAIQSVSIYLGRAFDKTFVALVLSLVQMALVYGVRRSCESTLFMIQERIARGVIPRLKC